MLADPSLKRKKKSTTQEPTLLLSTKTQKEFIDSHILMGKFTLERVPEFLPGKSPSHTLKNEVDLGFRRPISACSTTCLTKIILKRGILV